MILTALNEQWRKGLWRHGWLVGLSRRTCPTCNPIEEKGKIKTGFFIYLLKVSTYSSNGKLRVIKNIESDARHPWKPRCLKWTYESWDVGPRKQWRNSKISSPVRPSLSHQNLISWNFLLWSQIIFSLFFPLIFIIESIKDASFFPSVDPLYPTTAPQAFMALLSVSMGYLGKEKHSSGNQIPSLSNTYIT